LDSKAKQEKEYPFQVKNRSGQIDPIREAYRDKKNTSSLLAAGFIFDKVLIF
jgi:hypothetical protein